jgi:hypothetical protein
MAMAMAWAVAQAIAMAQAMAHGDSDGDGDGSSLWGWYPCTRLKFRGYDAQASVELSSHEWAIPPPPPSDPVADEFKILR